MLIASSLILIFCTLPTTLAQESPEALAKIETLLSGEGAAARQRGLALLGDLGPRGAFALEQVLALLDDPEVAVRRAAATGIGKIEPDSERAFSALVAALADTDYEVRQNLIASAQGLERSLPGRLEGWLPDPELGPGALEILCWKRADSLQRAEAALTAEHLEEKAVDILQAAGRRGVPGLVRALELEPTRSRAMRALRRLGAASPVGAATLEELFKDCRTKDLSLHELARIALTAGSPDSLSSEGLEQLAVHAEPSVRELAQWCISRRGEGASHFAAQMRAGLRDEDLAVRRTAAFALGSMAELHRSWSTDVIPGSSVDVGRHGGLGLEPKQRVLGRSSRGSASLRRWRVEWVEWPSRVLGLRRTGKPPADLAGAVGELATMAGQKDVLTSRAALWALGQCGPGAASARDKLIPILLDTTRPANLRREAMLVLLSSGGWEGSAELFVGLVDSELVESRLLGLEGLGFSHASSQIDVVRTALTSDRLDVRGAALEALVRLDPLPPELLDDLGRAFHSGERRAAGLLPGFGAAAVDVLVVGLESPMAPMRGVSVICLERLGRRARAALPALELLRQIDPEKEIRGAAKQAMRVINARRGKRGKR